MQTNLEHKCFAQDEETGHFIKYCFEGDIDNVRRLILMDVDIEGKDYDLRTALHLAASEGHLEIIKLLL